MCFRCVKHDTVRLTPQMQSTLARFQFVHDDVRSVAQKQLEQCQIVSTRCIGEPVRANGVSEENISHRWPEHRALEHLVCNPVDFLPPTNFCFPWHKDVVQQITHNASPTPARRHFCNNKLILTRSNAPEMLLKYTPSFWLELSSNNQVQTSNEMSSRQLC